ncbi:hypothetical protein PI125_g19568 [Phytophthora idaei]|nr:hypothetical protein PI125_g19568 [Phytophthora idaei]
MATSLFKMMNGARATTTKADSAEPECSLLKGADDARGGGSSTYCVKCKLPTASKKLKAWRVFLCKKKYHSVSGDPMPCLGIWH